MMAYQEERESIRREKTGNADWREGWRELLPDLLWPAVLALAVVMVIGLAL